jgi:hypothetical protein
MTNLEKKDHLEQMYNHAKSMVEYCEEKISTNNEEWSTRYSLEAFKEDAAALKYAIKGINLMQDLVNDASDEGGDYGF